MDLLHGIRIFAVDDLVLLQSTHLTEGRQTERRQQYHVRALSLGHTVTIVAPTAHECATINRIPYVGTSREHKAPN